MRLTIIKAAILALLAAPASANTVQIINDPGGPLLNRIVEIEIFNRKGAQVQIVGDFCYSSCTMLLGADDVCVAPETVFGFHGPYRIDNAAMTQAEFNHASDTVAGYYPTGGIREWFIAIARHVPPGELYYLNGEDLIGLGVSECP
jgi:hypothetical protein